MISPPLPQTRGRKFDCSVETCAVPGLEKMDLVHRSTNNVESSIYIPLEILEKHAPSYVGYPRRIGSLVFNFDYLLNEISDLCGSDRSSNQNFQNLKVTAAPVLSL